MCLMPVIVAQNAMAAGQTNSLFIKLNPGSQKVNIQMNSYTLQINNLTGVSNTSENWIRIWDTCPKNPNMTIMLTFL